MDPIEQATANLMLSLIRIYQNVPGGMVHDDCRREILNVYDKLRGKYELAEQVMDFEREEADKKEAFLAEQNRA